jgi:hypothetical protein
MTSRKKLYSLEQEERLIMQELIQIDEVDHVARQGLSKNPQQQQPQI